MATHLMQDPDVAVAQICRTLGVSRSTLYRYVGPNRAAASRAPAKPEHLRADSV